MQLDKTRIAIRERSFPDLLDLALRVIRAHAGALIPLWLMGALPLALLNYFLLESQYPLDEAGQEFPGSYLWHLALLMIWEIPLATAPLTLYLGQALFVERPAPREIAGQFLARFGQLLWYQGIIRGLLAAVAILSFAAGMHGPLLVLDEFVLVIIWFFLYILWPYLNEVLLLERNPWRKRPHRASTGSRTRDMHAHASGDLFGRWLMSLVVASALTLAGASTIWWLRMTLLLDDESERVTWQVLLPMAAWAVIGYFAIVRFLAYLDLRIRTEGWEVELALRAEGARLAGEVT
jgi:hypothetical protein